MLNVTALILAGGMGTRLRHVVGDRPKVLAEVNHRPFVILLLQQLVGAGVSEVILSTGYMADQVKSMVGEHYESIKIRYSPETSPLGTAGAIGQAKSLVTNWPLLVMNGDSFCEVDLIEFSNWHRERKAVGSLVLTQVAATGRFGQVQVKANGQVERFDEKGTQTGPGWISAGIYLLEPTLVETIPVGRPVSIEKETFPEWIGHGLFGYCGGGSFLDIGTPESYKAAEEFFSKVERP